MGGLQKSLSDIQRVVLLARFRGQDDTPTMSQQEGVFSCYKERHHCYLLYMAGWKQYSSVCCLQHIIPWDCFIQPLTLTFNQLDWGGGDHSPAPVWPTVVLVQLKETWYLSVMLADYSRQQFGHTQDRISMRQGCASDIGLCTRPWVMRLWCKESRAGPPTTFVFIKASQLLLFPPLGVDKRARSVNLNATDPQEQLLKTDECSLPSWECALFLLTAYFTPEALMSTLHSNVCDMD